MLPFRNGPPRRVLFVGLIAASLLVAPADFAQQSKKHGGKKNKDQEAAPQSATPSPGSGAQVPLPIGHEAKGLVLPDIDENGRLRGRSVAGTARRVDQDHMQFRELNITTYPKKKTDATNKNPFGTQSKNEGPITTEIYADEASFDSSKNVGVFTGHVKVFDPRFNLQSDKLTVYLRKGEDQGLEKAIAEGNVGVVRDRPDPNGGPPTHAVGRSEHAVYTATDGSVELTGMPKVQQGMNMHIATSSETVMVIDQDGHLNTHGPSRTEIRQEPTGEKP